MTSRPTLGLLVLGAGLSLAIVSAWTTVDAEPTADAGRGRAVFETKRCARCHLPRGRQGVGPALEALRQPQGAFELAGRLWNHAPAMFTVLTHEGIPWPEISAAEMADLMAYLGADPGRDPAPDPGKGQVALIRKGCLKCHRLKGEGGQIGPDLGVRRADYDSAAAWAAKMWVHTPRMAQKAIEVGVLYPRFAGDEAANLVGFLRSAAN